MLDAGPTTAPGGAAGALLALDPRRDDKDRGAVRTMLTRWPGRWRAMNDEKRQRIVAELEAAYEDAALIDDPDKRANVRASVSRTLAMIEAQTQADQHKEVDTLLKLCEAERKAAIAASEAGADGRVTIKRVILEQETRG